MNIRLKVKLEPEPELGKVTAQAPAKHPGSGRLLLRNPGYSIFAIFENGHFAADQLHIYMSNSPKKLANLAAHAEQFLFSKITGTLKNNYFFPENLQVLSFYF